jgi:hypothetical protein
VICFSVTVKVLLVPLVLVTTKSPGRFGAKICEKVTGFCDPTITAGELEVSVAPAGIEKTSPVAMIALQLRRL